MVVKNKSFEINSYAVSYTDKFKYYQYLRIAVKSILEERKENNENNFTSRYNIIKQLCSKEEIKFYRENYNLSNNGIGLLSLLEVLIYYNMPLCITLLLLILPRVK